MSLLCALHSLYMQPIFPVSPIAVKWVTGQVQCPEGKSLYQPWIRDGCTLESSTSESNVSSWGFPTLWSHLNCGSIHLPMLKWGLGCQPVRSQAQNAYPRRAWRGEIWILASAQPPVDRVFCFHSQLSPEWCKMVSELRLKKRSNSTGCFHPWTSFSSATLLSLSFISHALGLVSETQVLSNINRTIVLMSELKS